MNKRFLSLISLSAFMALTACGVNKPEPEEGGPAKIPEAYVDPEVQLTDAETANTTINFDPITETCMINEKAKTYIDAMEEQEKTLGRPYHFSSLYGPDDYAMLANESDKGDGITYPAEMTGGVDVCQILSNKDDSGYCKNYPIKLSWADDGSYSGAKVKFWSTEDRSDLREASVSVSGGKVTAELPNLFRARKYRVQVVAGDKISQGYEFTTGDYPRTISMGGIKNVRDIGGFVTSYGVRTNQGLLYRGYYIDDGNPSSHGQNYNAETQRVQEEVMKVSVELDLQRSSETGGRTKSAIDSTAIPVEYKCLTLISYENFLTEDSYKNLPEVFRYIGNADQKHVYFHCWGGADRTGMLAFFINAICGVSYTDLIEDFELTTQTNNKRCHMHNSSSAHYAKFMNAFTSWEGFDPDKTVNENIENWLLAVPQDNSGNKITQEDIEKIRGIMLPGYAEGTLQKDKLIPQYTYKAADKYWETDELAHWKKAVQNENVIMKWGRHTYDENGVCSVCGYEKEVAE